MEIEKTYILLIEDNPADARIVREYLAESSLIDKLNTNLFNVMHVDHLSRAIELLAVKHFDLIITDLSLPDSQGLETITQVCKAAPTQPIIILSGENDEMIAKQAVRKGAQDYLLKNHIDSQLLIHAIHYAKERKKIELRLEELAYYDTLTGLANRSQLIKKVEEAIDIARQHGWRVAILFLDLDRFKMINDVQGHEIGDQVLQIVAKRLRSNLHSSDYIGRLGGDEFVIILQQIDSDSIAAITAERILAEIKNVIIVNKNKYFIGASIGISIFPENGNDVQTLLKNADIAMYNAKQYGGNNYQFCHNEMSREVQKRMELEKALNEALDKNNFQLSYQPQIDPKTGQIVSIEALLRLPTNDGSLMTSSEFIHIAEESGLILQIGELVLNAACADFKRWKDAQINDKSKKYYSYKVAINISSYQLLEDKFSERVLNIINKNHLNPTEIELEITESSLTIDIQKSAKCIQKLKETGVYITIDNFGMGFSSLRYIKSLKIDNIKIDRSFIFNVPEDKNNTAIVSAFITMGHTLGISVSAQGVETAKQAKFLIEHQCDRLQGFYLCKPLSSDEIFYLILKERNNMFSNIQIGDNSYD